MNEAVVLTPERGSVSMRNTVAPSSTEFHVSVLIVIGASLPSMPAGITLVTRDPSASTPLIVLVPRDSEKVPGAISTGGMGGSFTAGWLGREAGACSASAT